METFTQNFGHEDLLMYEKFLDMTQLCKNGGGKKIDSVFSEVYFCFSDFSRCVINFWLMLVN